MQATTYAIIGIGNVGRILATRLLAVDTLRPSLEDVFVQLTGLSAEVMLAEKGSKGGGNAGG